jgi:hypothetical protein
MAQNQAISGRYHINVPVPAACTVGMPVLVGVLSGVILALQPIPTPLVPVSATIDLGDDCYTLTVVGQSQLSPTSGFAVALGDELFASGTYDPTTNVTYNLTLDKTRGNTPFGNALSAVASGVTSTTCVVRLKGGGSGPYAA